MTPDELREIEKTLKPITFVLPSAALVQSTEHKRWRVGTAQVKFGGIHACAWTDFYDTPEQAVAAWNGQGEMKPTGNSPEPETITPAGNESADEFKVWARCARKARRSFVQADMTPKPNLWKTGDKPPCWYKFARFAQRKWGKENPY